MKKTFRTRTYEIHTDKLKNGHKVRFAFLTDLHGLIYGNNHQELYDAVLKHDPAAVLVAGDMIVNRKTETLQAAAVLLSRLSEKIPVFYTLGNHEYKMLLNPEVRQEYLNYERLLTSAGVCFLHNERISSNFCGTDFIFHGLELPIEYYLQNSVSQSWKNFSGHRSCRGYIFFWHITLNMEIRIFPGVRTLFCPDIIMGESCALARITG